jgi:hypothetical protein
VPNLSLGQNGGGESMPKKFQGELSRRTEVQIFRFSLRQAWQTYVCSIPILSTCFSMTLRLRNSLTPSFPNTGLFAAG